MHGPSRAASSIGMRSHLLTDIRISSGGMDNSGREGTDAKKAQCGHAPWPAWLNSCALSRVECNIPNFDSKHSDTFFSVLVFLQSRHKQIPKKHHINTVSTSHISNTHITFTRNAADHNITQSVLTRCHLPQSIVRAGKMLSITILPP